MRTIAPYFWLSARRRRGTALVFIIILATTLTGLTLTLAWAAAVQADVADSRMQLDRTLYVSEGIAQAALWQFKHNSAWRKAAGAPWTGSVTVNGKSYTYSVTCVTDAVNTNAIDISATVTQGASSQVITFTYVPPSSSAPTLANPGNANISGNVTLTGNQETNGDINANANLHITGNLKAGGNINGSPTVGGTKTAHATGLSPPSVSAIYTTVKNQAGYTINSPSSISTIDFTTAANHIVFINGDANMSSNITVIGSGTVVVSGNWNQSGNFPASGSATANIVIQGDANISGNLNLTGSLYAGGNWNQSGNFTVTGVALVHGDDNISGGGTITAATAVPSFDSRNGSTSGGLTGFINQAP